MALAGRRIVSTLKTTDHFELINCQLATWIRIVKRPDPAIHARSGPQTNLLARRDYCPLFLLINSCLYASLAKIATSTRRFCWRPSSVSLVAFGSDSPRPEV